ncbi:MAG: hypothetical protein ACOC5T_09645 [Elusimicrobiota bacterium]
MKEIKCDKCGEKFKVSEIDEERYVFCGKCIKTFTRYQKLGKEKIELD